MKPPRAVPRKQWYYLPVPQPAIQQEEPMNRIRVAVALTGLVGLASSAFAQAPAAPTFSKDVAPILYQNCTSCHRAGEIGPMPLISFNDARPWAKASAWST